MTFDPKKYLIKVRGDRQYLPVSARLIWFREVHPDWGIETRPIALDTERQLAVFEASVFNETGKLMAKGTKMEDVRGFPDYVEKAETGAIGRALAVCGFGTQFAPEFDETAQGRFVDSPQAHASEYADPAPETAAPAPSEAHAPAPAHPEARTAAPDASSAASSGQRLVCSACGRDLTQSQEAFSKRKFGVALCPACQKGHRAAEAV